MSPEASWKRIDNVWTWTMLPSFDDGIMRWHAVVSCVYQKLSGEYVKFSQNRFVKMRLDDNNEFRQVIGEDDE